jgi:hypothetical protein
LPINVNASFPQVIVDAAPEYEMPIAARLDASSVEAPSGAAETLDSEDTITGVMRLNIKGFWPTG